MTKKEMFFRIILPVTCLLVVVAIALGVYFGVFYKKNEEIEPPENNYTPTLSEIDRELLEKYTFEKCTIDGVSGYSVGRRSKVVYPSILELPDSFKDLPVISTGLFQGHEEIEQVRFPVMIMKIGDFSYTGLKEVHIPSSVRKIGIQAFSACKSLTKVVIEDGVSEIDGIAFANCTQLTSLIIPNSVKTIGGGAFSTCTNLTSIVLPKDLKEIKDNTFYECQSLKSITIPNGVTKIGYGAFFNCKLLESVNIPANVMEIGEFAFNSCDLLKTISFASKASWANFSVASSSFSSCGYPCELVINGSAGLLQTALSKFDCLEDKNAFIVKVPNIYAISNNYGFVVESIS